MESKKTTSAVKGLVIALILIVIGLIIHFAGLERTKGIGSIQFALFIGGIIWACISYAKQENGNLTFGNAFAHGFKTTAAVTAIIGLYTFLAFKFIIPEMVETGLEEARKGMIEKNMPADQMEQGLAMARKFFIPFAISGMVVMFLILGCIASLIGAAVAKKNPEYNPLQENN